jgi:hypothetical protein
MVCKLADMAVDSDYVKSSFMNNIWKNETLIPWFWRRPSSI